MFKEIVDFIQDHYATTQPIYLHEPLFIGNEKAYLNDAIDSTFVSSVGAYVNKFEDDFARYLSVDKAVVCMNGTAALHMSLILAGVGFGDEVITQPLTFVATCNAISYQGASPIFIDVDRDTMGLSPAALKSFLEENAEVTEAGCRNKSSGKIIRAVVPMHTFGHTCRIDEIATICQQWKIALIEDAAEALGSSYKGKPLGTFGDVAAYSFNGNKIITTGAGGMIIGRDADIMARAKHLTTTAKVPHPYEFYHDEVGYNYRMPNLNAALGCAQLEKIDLYLEAKRKTAMAYKSFFENRPEAFVDEPENARSNFWLNAIIVEDLEARNQLLEGVNKMGVMVRPIWTLMNKLPAFRQAQSGPLDNAEWLEARVINLPSSVNLSKEVD